MQNTYRKKYTFSHIYKVFYDKIMILLDFHHCKLKMRSASIDSDQNKTLPLRFMNLSECYLQASGLQQEHAHQPL